MGNELLNELIIASGLSHVEILSNLKIEKRILDILIEDNSYIEVSLGTKMSLYKLLQSSIENQTLGIDFKSNALSFESVFPEESQFQTRIETYSEEELPSKTLGINLDYYLNLSLENEKSDNSLILEFEIEDNVPDEAIEDIIGKTILMTDSTFREFGGGGLKIDVIEVSIPVESLETV